LADAVERLARAGGEAPDEASVAMGRSLLTPGVASRMAARLGTAREEARRADLVATCVRLGRDMALALADALSDTTDRFARRAYLDAMVAMGSDGMSVAEEMVEDGRWFVVRNAVAILGEVGGERAVELLISSLAHTDARVRREALLSLAKVGGEDAGMLVYGMIEDPDPEVRLSAAMAAGALKVERALKPLLSLLETESDSDVVVAVLRALGQLGDPGATNAVEKRAVASFFSKPPTDVRIAAYRALHNIGTPRAKSLIQEAAEDKDPEVRGAVRHLLAAQDD
jgi:HEAT repeat protein